MDWRTNSEKRLVLDNGSHRIRFGNQLNKSTQLNLIAQLKKSGQLVYELEGLFDESQVMKYYKPHVRGVLVDFDKQINIWDRFLQGKQLKDTSITFPYQPFTPEQVHNKMFEVMFEYYGIDALCPIISQVMLQHYAKQQNQDISNTFTYVIDSSHSATYFVPIFDGEVITSAIRRMDIGGKLLTNHLKDIISFKQFNFKNYDLLSMRIKEQMCFISNDFIRDMRQQKKSLQKYYVLPDFEVQREGYSIDLLNVGFLDAKVALDKERISVPELLFKPSDIGLSQKGPVAMLKDSLESMNVDLRGYFTENIIIGGGNTLFENYSSRLSKEIRQEMPTDWDVNIRHLNNVDAVFEGAILYNQTTQFMQSVFTKAEFMEKGFDRIKSYM